MMLTTNRSLILLSGTLLLVALGLLFFIQPTHGNPMTTDPENTLIMTLPDGDVVIKLNPKKAPKHVERMKELVRSHKYDGIAFHRVIPGFMAQTGDVEYGQKEHFNPSRVGTGGSTLGDLPAEFNDTPHIRGTLSMARSANPDSANSQFFICFADAPHLDGEYTAFGQVIEGMEHVDALAQGDGGNGSVSKPDFIERIVVQADQEKTA